MTKTIEIQSSSELATLINLFVVEPNNQDKLIEMLKEGIETFISKQPGYVAAGLHKGMDGRHAVVYSQWRSSADIETLLKNPQASDYFQHIRAMAQIDPIVYEVSYVHKG
jgi:heme-degrading monooxygenase HmoA